MSTTPVVDVDAQVQEPPVSLWQALRKIGPGIVLAGSIVGSGELILTTSLGAKNGFCFLWLILLSCVIKVFVQIELGRYALSSGQPTLTAFNSFSGPRLGAHWTVWWWLFMMLATVSQLGGMVGGVAQALHMAFPGVSPAVAGMVPEALGLAETLKAHPLYFWAVLTALAAAILLASGGYQFLEGFTTFLVVGITSVTLLCVFILPYTGFPITVSDWLQGFNVYAASQAGLYVAVATFGVTGVGASELYAYPYWCLEKGYGKFVGPKSNDPAWERRAKGWIRVMNLDAWVSMIVFTAATVAFYILGATVLHRQGLKPEDSQMIATLSQMYIPAFGEWTQTAFLIGAWAVLFKTLYVASAGHCRMIADFVRLAGFVQFPDDAHRRRFVRMVSVFFPLGALSIFIGVGNPPVLVAFGGYAQALTLPLIAGATLMLRYKRTDPRIAPRGWWDVMLWLAFGSILIVVSFDLARKLFGSLFG